MDRVGKGSTDDEATWAEPWPVQEKVTPLSISHLIRHTSTVHFYSIRKGAPPIAVYRCLRDRSAPVGGDMSLLAAATMSGVRRLARLAAYYLMHATILLGATMLWGSYAILVAVHPAWRRKTAKFLRCRMSTNISISIPHITFYMS